MLHFYIFLIGCEWSDWGFCSKTCGNGIAIRTHNITKGIVSNHPDCSLDKAQETRCCNIQKCPGIKFLHFNISPKQLFQLCLILPTVLKIILLFTEYPSQDTSIGIILAWYQGRSRAQIPARARMFQ